MFLYELIKLLDLQDNEYMNLVKYYENKLRNTNRKSFYYNSYLKKILCFNSKRQFIKEIKIKLENN